MALMNCPECQHRVSDAATACPGCAYPIRSPTPTLTTGTTLRKKANPASIAVVLIIAAAGMYFLFVDSDGADKTAASTSPTSTVQAVDNATPLQGCSLGAVALPEVSGTAASDWEGICNEIQLAQGKPPSSHLLVMTAKSAFVFRTHGYDAEPKDIAYLLMNIVEARGQAQASDDVKISTLDTVVKIWVAWNGHITPKDILTFLHSAGEAGTKLSDDGLTSMMAVVLQEKRHSGEQ